MLIENIFSRTCKDGFLEHRLTVTPSKTPVNVSNIYDREAAQVVGWLVRVFCERAIEAIAARLNEHLRAKARYQVVGNFTDREAV